MPAAVTEKLAFCPAVMIWFAGCTVMLGATTAAVTVSVTTELVTLLLAPATTTRYFVPVSDTTVAGVV